MYVVGVEICLVCLGIFFLVEIGFWLGCEVMIYWDYVLVF